MRLPPPTTSGSIITRNSSTRSKSMSDCTSFALPITNRLSPSFCFRVATAFVTLPLSNVEFCQVSGSLRVVDATYFGRVFSGCAMTCSSADAFGQWPRSEEHTSELQSLTNLVCRLLLEKKKTHKLMYPRL